MHDTAALIRARIDRVYRDRVLPALAADTRPVAVEAWVAPGEPVPFAEAAAQRFEPFAIGTPWGRPWGTTWFRLSGTVPPEWGAARAEVHVDLGFIRGNPGFQSEGLVWREDGTVLKALEPRNHWIPVEADARGAFSVLLEAASNPDIGGQWTHAPTPLGDPATAGDEPLYTFRRAELVLRDAELVELERDWAVLADLITVLPEVSARRARILRSLERAADVLDPDDAAGTASAARAELAEVLASPAEASAHRIAAVGHAHIDSAWLWPVRETMRKVARTFSNVLQLMDEHPDFVFAASSAQQYQWMRDHYPDVYERMRARIAEGRFVPVGGMWVESDTNLPGGEALARQLVAGKGFFLREFGVDTREVWLPDSFGYTGALPQIVAASGTEYFLTQKISWNETNVMPHHSFLWEGIDGSRVFTHFPPADTYNSEVAAEDLARAARQHAERGLSDRSLLPFGYGDGGGGPTREMIATARRLGDLEGSPRVSLQRPDEFFDAARADVAEPPVWSGEMYLEFHRGTYTSQARTKLGNRRSEHLLREAELWAATAAVRTGAEYPAERLAGIWQTVLLQQFHDILPGSSIAWVHQDAEREYARVGAELEVIVTEALAALGDAAGAERRANASPVPVDGVAPLGGGTAARAPRTLQREGAGWALRSDRLHVRIAEDGTIASLLDLARDREAIAPGGVGNLLQLFRDTPNQWDAWDIDRHYQRTPLDRLGPAAVAADGDALTVRRAFGASSVEQRLELSPDGTALEIMTTVDWHESQKLLKLAFDLDVHADTAASEIQFGHIRRATHGNTSWDAARFETVAHRWVHVDETGFGVSLANDRVYGHDVTRLAKEGGGSSTLVRETLLRAPTFPDPSADQGVHVFRHSLVPGGIGHGIAEGYRLNLPLRAYRGDPVAPLVAVEGSDAALVEAVKLAEDGSGDVIVRLYESRGGRARGALVPGFAAGGARRVDLLERDLTEQPEDALRLDLRAFELVTVRIPRA